MFADFASALQRIQIVFPFPSLSDGPWEVGNLMGVEPTIQQKCLHCGKKFESYKCLHYGTEEVSINAVQMARDEELMLPL